MTSGCLSFLNASLLGITSTPAAFTTMAISFRSTKLNPESSSYQHQNLRVRSSPHSPKSKATVPVRCAAAINKKPVGGDQMLVYVPPHPLIKHWVSVLRNEMTPPPLFRSAMAELGRILIYEASRDWLVTVSGEIQTPCGVAECEFIDPREPVKIIPILRAGLVLVEQVGSVLPATQTYHLGYVRDEETLQPTMYLNKWVTLYQKLSGDCSRVIPSTVLPLYFDRYRLVGFKKTNIWIIRTCRLPEGFPEGSRVLITDPMLATGGTIVAALDELRSRGADPKLMRVICAVAAPPALTKLSEKFPGLRVYAGIIDPDLNDKGYIIPGLGDAGDRSYNTGS